MTKGRTPVLSQLPTISDVEAYLQSKGWTKIIPPNPDRANPNVLVYRGGSDIEGTPLTVSLPAQPDLIDTKRRLSDVIRFLATLEAKSSRQMTQEIIAMSPSQHSAISTGSITARQIGKRLYKTAKNSV